MVREKAQITTQISEKINLVWDYYSEYVNAPVRTEQIPGINVVSPSFFSLKNADGVEIIDNAKRGGNEYIAWAKTNGYKIWAMFSNNSLIYSSLFFSSLFLPCNKFSKNITI